MNSWPGFAPCATRPAQALLEVLAIGRLRRGASISDLAFYDAADRELLRMWVRDGLTSWPQQRADRRGAILKLYLNDLAQARPLLARIPSVFAEVLTFQLIPLVSWQSIGEAAGGTGDT